MHPRRHSWHSSACEIEMLLRDVVGQHGFPRSRRRSVTDRVIRSKIVVVGGDGRWSRREGRGIARAEPRDVCFCVRGVEPEEHQWLLLIARVLPCPRRRMVAFFRPQKAGRSRACGAGPLGSATLTSHYVGKPADPFELLFLCSREQNGFRRRDMLGAQAWHSASSRRSTPRWRRMTRTVHSTGQVEASGAALGRH